MGRVDLEAIQSNLYRRKEEAWTEFLRGPHFRPGMDRDTFLYIYGLGWLEGKRTGYDEGFNDSEMTSHHTREERKRKREQKEA